MSYKKFQNTVWSYYRKHGRHDLPWRSSSLKPQKDKALNPYQVLVSEVMLQQTQAPRIIPKYNEWIKRFPNFKQLAQAPLGEVLTYWQGLGYNRRALNLKRTAEIVTSEYHGKLPRDYDVLIALPGIGPYTASAIRAFAWNLPDVVIETNIRSVFLHHFFRDEANVPDRDILPLIEKTLDQNNPREWYWALMDYGTYLKTTQENPSRRARSYTKQSRFQGSNRELRAQILRLVVSEKSVTTAHIKTKLDNDPRIETNLRALTEEGFFEKRGNVYKLRS